MSTVQKIIFSALGALLLSAVFAIECVVPFQGIASTAATLDNVVPSSLTGWRVEDLPLAETERGQAETLKVLQCDEWIYRRFSRGDLDLDVYVAHWRPNSIPSALVAEHVPDNCWANAGWTINYAKSVSLRHYGIVEERLVQVRQFIGPQKQRAEVLYWHTGDQSLIRISEPVMHNLITRSLGAVSDIMAGRKDRYICRVSTRGNIENFMSRPEVREMIATLVKRCQ